MTFSFVSSPSSVRVGLKVAHLLVNQVYPDRFPAQSPQLAVLDALGAEVDAGTASPDLAALHAHADLARHRILLNQRYIDQLAHTVPAPLSLFPRLFVPSFGPAEIEVLSHLVERALTEPAAAASAQPVSAP